MAFAASTVEVSVVFVELGAIFAGLALLARLAGRGGLSPIPLYLLAGIVLGMIGLREEVSEEFVSVGAQIGVVLLLFILGLEYTGEELKDGLRTGWLAGIFDIVANFTPGFLLGLVLGWDLVAAIVLGGVTYISSSGIIAKTLGDLGRLGNRETPVILTVLVFEDLVMAVFLPVLGVLLVGGSATSGALTIAVAIAVVFVALLSALRFGALFSRILYSESDEAVLLAVFGVVLLIAGIFEGLQVSSAVGAFLVGISLSGRVAERSRVLIGPLRDFFAATFFLFFGLTIEIEDVPGMLIVAIGLAVVTALTKFGTGWWAAARAGVGRRGRMRAGTALIARGEFSIVIAELGVAAAVEPTLGALAAAYVLLLAFAGPVITRFAGALRRVPQPA